jgi:hypothetical protein
VCVDWYELAEGETQWWIPAKILIHFRVVTKPQNVCRNGAPVSSRCEQLQCEHKTYSFAFPSHRDVPFPCSRYPVWADTALGSLPSGSPVLLQFVFVSPDGVHIATCTVS